MRPESGRYGLTSPVCAGTAHENFSIDLGADSSGVVSPLLRVASLLSPQRSIHPTPHRVLTHSGRNHYPRRLLRRRAHSPAIVASEQSLEPGLSPRGGSVLGARWSSAPSTVPTPTIRNRAAVGGALDRGGAQQRINRTELDSSSGRSGPRWPTGTLIPRGGQQPVPVGLLLRVGWPHNKELQLTSLRLPKSGRSRKAARMTSRKALRGRQLNRDPLSCGN